jgi:hypothetical protein
VKYEISGIFSKPIARFLLKDGVEDGLWIELMMEPGAAAIHTYCLSERIPKIVDIKNSKCTYLPFKDFL